MNGPLETGDMFVVTVSVPTTDAGQLTVSVEDGAIRVLGPDGFRHEVPLPAGADAERLHADLFHDILELRAPRSDAAVELPAREVPVRTAS
jgi:HSP20 family molecular chaperone IbpA